MSKRCEYCKKEIPDDASLCRACGTFQTADKDAGVADTRLKFKTSGVKIVFAVIAVAVIVSLIFLSKDLNKDVYDDGGYETACNKYMDILNGKSQNFEALAPKVYWEKIKSETGFDIKQYEKELKEKAETENEAETEASEGAVTGDIIKASDIKAPVFKYKIRDEKKLKGDEFRQLNNTACEACGKDDKEFISDAYRLNIDTYVSGTDPDEEGTDVGAYSLYAVKIEGYWYPISREFGFYVDSLIDFNAE